MSNVVRENVTVLYDRRLESRFGILFTYRYGLEYKLPKPINFKRRRLFNIFSPLNLSNDVVTIDTDKGWGCVLRSTQMAISQALMNLVLGPEFSVEQLEIRNRSPRNKKIDESILNLDTFEKLINGVVDLDEISAVSVILAQFYDDLNAVFSIYNFIIADYVLKTCTKFLHFGPTSAALCASKIINDSNLPIHSIAFPDGVFHISDVREILDDKRNLLVWVSNKKKLDRIERECVKSMFRLSQFNGIIGGNLFNKSYYIFGTTNKRLYYNDPHLYCKKAFRSLEFVDIFRDFTSRRVKSMNWRYFNSSFTLLFLFKDQDDFQDFLENTFERKSIVESFPFEFITYGDLTFN
ncbi:Peptidase family C54 family protein [Theileria parva strain Muguga]|uniref:Peptidase family C54 family protein n=1 Tax=Theileria parva strain Muguga TaxID=333668 RepID=UPI001C6207B7|nr:Peptidase family C54 family protein [Theileria parva strain Muguga]EAN32788.2 Peptidase family C54 family protein [Theileria parva strain Muguga]